MTTLTVPDFSAQRAKLTDERDELATRRQPLALAAESGDTKAAHRLDELEQALAAVAWRLERLDLAEAAAKRQAAAAEREAEAAHRAALSQQCEDYRAAANAALADVEQALQPFLAAVRAAFAAGHAWDGPHLQLTRDPWGSPPSQQVLLVLADYLGHHLGTAGLRPMLQPAVGAAPGMAQMRRL